MKFFVPVIEHGRYYTVPCGLLITKMYNPGMSLNLARALRVDRGQCIAFVGSGGKTTAMFQLARQLTPPVIVTSTTHLGEWQTSLADSHRIAQSTDSIQEIEKELSGVFLITGALDGDRMKPVADDVLHEIHQLCQSKSIPLLVEADGSRQKPLKIWAEHEPPIPEFADHVVQVVGLSVIGKPLSEELVHRFEIFSKFSDQKSDSAILPSTLTQIILHENSALRKMPAQARKTILLNQADTHQLQSVARFLTTSFLSRFDSALIASLAQKEVYAAHEKAAGIILAAGESSRYGKPKQLLDWRGEAFVKAVANQAVLAGLSPVIVVTGAEAELVSAAVNEWGVQAAFNPDWKSGQASSIKLGIRHLLSTSKTKPGGAIFLLADQPQINTAILEKLQEKHADGLYPIIAPMVMDRRANPVLFDQSTFSDLLTLEGDVGGRAIFHKYPVEYLPWHDDRLLLDVDTPEQYQRLIQDDSL